MKQQTINKKSALALPMANNFTDRARAVADTCVDCSICVKQCRFLTRHGSPRRLAQLFLDNPTNNLAFHCSLCRLCTAVCPKDVDPAALCMAQRCQVAHRQEEMQTRYRSLLAYEKWGSSSLLSSYALPEGCDTIFFPGCALPGSRPQRVLDVIDQLRRQIPNLGVVLDCCTKPSHDLGRLDYFQNMFSGLHGFLEEKGIRKVLVACPNCHRMFSEYGRLEVQTIYERLSAPHRAEGEACVTVHDPCGVRFATEIHSAARRLISETGLSVQEMKHHGPKTLCCGEGGAVGYLDRDLAQTWTELRRQEAQERPVITYCAGCSHFLGKRLTCHHLLDLVFAPQATLADRVRVSRSPLTYWQRWRLKKKIAALLAPHRPLSRREAQT